MIFTMSKNYAGNMKKFGIEIKLFSIVQIYVNKQTNATTYWINQKLNSTIIHENSNNSNLLWKKLNNIFHRKNDSVLPESENDKTLSETFSSFFLDKRTRIQNTFHGNTYPSFKRAIVIPLIKKSSLPKNELKNYRPVSGLCFISKLVERSVAVQVKHHIDKNNLGNTFQSAYNSGHATEIVHCYLSRMTYTYHCQNGPGSA